MKFEVTKLPKNAFSLKVNVAGDEVAKIRGHVIAEMVKEVELPGFRKGAVPLEMAEKTLEESKIRGEVINHVVATFYPQALKESHLTPIIYPRIEIKEFEVEKDLVFEAKFCERPEVRIGNYALSLNDLSKKSVGAKLVGTDGQPLSKKSDEDLDRILEAVLQVCQVEVPDLLIDEEVNHMLSRLIDQTARLGLTVEQYLKSSNRTVEQVKEEYRQAAEKTIRLEFVLHAIGEQENISISEAEISDTIKAAPDEQSRSELEREENKNYIKSVLLKNKVVQKLNQIYEKAKNNSIQSS